MTKFNSPLYYCTECKTLVSSLEKLLFVEEKSTKGFCSEDCIEDFYRPLIDHYEQLEKATRKRLNLETESIQNAVNDKDLVEEVLKAPGEIYNIENELSESLTIYIRHFEDFSAVVICTVYNEQASFIFFSTLTRSKIFLQEFRTANRLETPEKEMSEEFNEEDFEFIQLLENKKSKLLADILVKRKDADIPFEEFNLYESCFQETLEIPDEVFESKDNEGDIFFVYIKSFMREGEDFFYIISCLKKKDYKEDNSEVNAFPVLAFPTNDMELYREFRVGQRLSAPIKN